MPPSTMIRLNAFATIVLAVGLLASGCHKKEITETDRKMALNAASDAQFAMGIKEFPRAVEGFQKAFELCYDNADYALNLGIAQVKAGKKSDAKSSYKSALGLYQDAYKKDKNNLAAAQQILFIDLVLHETSDAKSFLDQMVKDHPDNTGLANFAKAGGVDKLADQPQIKDLGI